MHAVQFTDYGGPEVLQWSTAPEPHPGPGEVRIRVKAASVNPIDWKIRTGAAGGEPLGAPEILGFDAAGIVDQLGEGVTDVQVGDAVFGLGSHTQAELAVLKTYAAKPESVPFATAAAVGTASETASRVFGLLGVREGGTVFIDGGSGGVGSVAVQVALARRAVVIASSSEANLSYLRGLGAIAVPYGPGLAQRVLGVSPQPIQAVFDVAGKSDIHDLLALVPEPTQVVSIANFAAGESGARVTTGGEGNPGAALQEIAEFLESGRVRIEVETLAMSDAAEAHRRSQEGHVRGKLVLVPDSAGNDPGDDNLDGEKPAS